MGTGMENTFQQDFYSRSFSAFALWTLEQGEFSFFLEITKHISKSRIQAVHFWVNFLM